VLRETKHTNLSLPENSPFFVGILMFAVLQ